MKARLSVIAYCTGAALMLAACAQTATTPDYTVYVNPFIGTGGHGGWDACSGYYYADSTINGFSHNHVSGTGCADYGDFLLMPTVGEQQYNPQDYVSQTEPYASPFSHENETAEPGYYSVFLDRYGVKAELTSTPRAALHRYTFPETTDAGFILDMDYSIQYQTNLDMQVEVVSDTEIKGPKEEYNRAVRYC